ncbi:hypothetical protein Moror_972 [Moniliophthora roreri MCA 2997]|uniref:Carboxylic ester hydrolase n=2 Tax=Moniliophthora roreri TaxID=221103 RepID=V2X9T2_MONRO|nr:hypothetical protein Moror_972 [Moniliophthora roreri MCA 2997]KAI3616001.1 hypothetical protein WG66_010279 [Moniliophthora roreri]
MLLRTFLLLLLQVFSLKTSCTASASARGDDVVDTGYARYLGNRAFSNSVAYLGIPYAEPPLGERRFRAPLALNKTRIAQESKGKVVNATEYPDFCIQGTTGGGDAGGAGSEDCLKVNIYAPAGAQKGVNLPVLVYIHGGGYVFGNPRNWPFEHWIHQSPNVVIVSVYYRLDAFGFLSTPELRNPVNGDLNAGFLDQIQALKWVKENIASFGGDPQKVTINGESAGGGSVQLHLVANERETLFSGAIAQSVYRVPVPTPEQQQPLFEFFASASGCGAGGVADQLACLRKASVGDLARAQDKAFTGPYRSFHPVVDGKVITDNPTSLILSGKFAKVPLVIGATSNETVIGGSDISTALKNAFPGLTDKDIQDLLEIAPENDFSSTSQRQQVVTGESILICARNIVGGVYSQAIKAWTYRYNQPNPTSGSTTVAHAAENWMMFLGTNTGVNGTTTFTPMKPVETAFAEELIAYWLSFVRSGDPNRFKLSRSPFWPEYTLTGPPENVKQRIVLQQDPSNTTIRSGSFIETEPANESRRCQVVASKAKQEQN